MSVQQCPSPKATSAPAPLIAHIIHRLSIGGLENGLVNLINHMPPERYRHAIVCLTDYDEFRARIERADVPVIALHKRPGLDLGVHLRVWRVLARLRPAVVHTRNLAALECVIPAALAGVRARVHGEHGRDVYDLDGSRRRYILWRRSLQPLVSCYVGVSQDLTQWLVDRVGIRPARVRRIYNGVDERRFRPRAGARAALGPNGFVTPASFVIGAVGRMQTVKDQLTLVSAFLHLVATEPVLRPRVRLVVIGDGPLRAEAARRLDDAGARDLAWLPGERSDVPEIMRAFDLFVLPSLAEGISNTVLEAMATALPIVATRVGGNAELVDEGRTGALVPPADPVAMARAIREYAIDPECARRHGSAGRQTIERRWSIEAMVNEYLSLYDSVLGAR